MIIVVSKLLSELLSHAKIVRDTVQLQISDEKISILTVDTGNVMMFHGSIPCKMDTEQYSFWVKIPQLLKILSRLSNELIIRRESTNSVTGEDHFRLCFLQDGFLLRIREEELGKRTKLPNIFYSMSFSTKRKIISNFCECVKDLEGEKVWVQCNADTKEISMKYEYEEILLHQTINAQFDTYSKTNERSNGEIDDYKVNQKSLYSISYLLPALKSFSPNSNLMMRFTQDHPIRFGKYENDTIFEYLLAPRIEA